MEQLIEFISLSEFHRSLSRESSRTIVVDIRICTDSM